MSLTIKTECSDLQVIHNIYMKLEKTLLSQSNLIWTFKMHVNMLVRLKSEKLKFPKPD